MTRTFLLHVAAIGAGPVEEDAYRGVALVAPAAARIRCDLRAAWMPQEAEPAARLRKGEG